MRPSSRWTSAPATWRPWRPSSTSSASTCTPVSSSPTTRRAALPPSGAIPGTGPRTTMDWEVWPAALHRIVMRMHRDYGKPIYITENGCAEPTGPGADGRVHDADRVDYLAGHVGQLARAIDDGCDVRGYFAWSLLDNFEWAAGYTQRFGIAWVDVEDDLRRVVKDSGWWMRDLARQPRDRLRRNAGLSGPGGPARPRVRRLASARRTGRSGGAPPRAARTTSRSTCARGRPRMARRRCPARPRRAPA